MWRYSCEITEQTLHYMFYSMQKLSRSSIQCWLYFQHWVGWTVSWYIDQERVENLMLHLFLLYWIFFEKNPVISNIPNILHVWKLCFPQVNIEKSYGHQDILGFVLQIQKPPFPGVDKCSSKRLENAGCIALIPLNVQWTSVQGRECCVWGFAGVLLALWGAKQDSSL